MELKIIFGFRDEFEKNSQKAREDGYTCTEGEIYLMTLKNSFGRDETFFYKYYFKK